MSVSRPLSATHVTASGEPVATRERSAQGGDERGGVMKASSDRASSRPRCRWPTQHARPKTRISTAAFVLPRYQQFA
jgi:hypothetical protein